MQYADVWRMCREHDVSLLVQKDEVLELVKLTNLKFGVDRKEFTSLRLQVFPEFIVQLAYRCFSHAPKDLRHREAGFLIKEFFLMCAASMKHRKENTAIIEDPDSLFLRGDRELIKEVN